MLHHGSGGMSLSAKAAPKIIAHQVSILIPLTLAHAVVRAEGGTVMTVDTIVKLTVLSVAARDLAGQR